MLSPNSMSPHNIVINTTKHNLRNTYVHMCVGMFICYVHIMCIIGEPLGEASNLDAGLTMRLYVYIYISVAFTF